MRCAAVLTRGPGGGYWLAGFEAGEETMIDRRLRPGAYA